MPIAWDEFIPMKITARSLRLFVLAGALSGIAYSQAMIQYGTAAATGAAAGAAGRSCTLGVAGPGLLETVV